MSAGPETEDEWIQTQLYDNCLFSSTELSDQKDSEIAYMARSKAFNSNQMVGPTLSSLESSKPTWMLVVFSHV